MATPLYSLSAYALGHEQLTVGASAVALPNAPDSTRRTVIRVLGQPINWRDDDVAPTGSTGMPLLPDETLVFDGDPSRFKVIRAASATADADVRIAYYR